MSLGYCAWNTTTAYWVIFRKTQELCGEYLLIYHKLYHHFAYIVQVYSMQSTKMIRNYAVCSSAVILRLLHLKILGNVVFNFPSHQYPQVSWNEAGKKSSRFELWHHWPTKRCVNSMWASWVCLVVFVPELSWLYTIVSKTLINDDTDEKMY